MLTCAMFILTANMAGTVLMSVETFKRGGKQIDFRSRVSL